MLFWLLMIVIAVLIQASFSMIEMASVTINRIHLAYLVHKKESWAIKLNYLLSRPYRLFGTVMVGVNLALQIGSQSAREMYTYLGLNPDLAPLTQVFVVVIFAELVPLLIARSAPESTVKIFIPWVSFIYRLFSPILFLFTLTARIGYLFSQKRWKREVPSLSREELSIVIPDKRHTFNRVISHFFHQHEKTAQSLMLPISEIPEVSISLSIEAAFEKLHGAACLLLKREKTLVGYVTLLDLINSKGKLNPRTFHTFGQTTPARHLLAYLKAHPERVLLITKTGDTPVGIVTLKELISHFV